MVVPGFPRPAKPASIKVKRQSTLVRTFGRTSRRNYRRRLAKVPGKARHFSQKTTKCLADNSTLDPSIPIHRHATFNPPVAVSAADWGPGSGASFPDHHSCFSNGSNTRFQPSDATKLWWRTLVLRVR